MVIFGKNKQDRTTRKQIHRYDLSSVADQEIADVLLTEKNESPLKAALLEPDSDNKGSEVIYELVVEDADTPAQEPPETASSLNAQVEKLCQEYESVNRQLEKSLAASNDLSRLLKKSKKTVLVSYIALAIALLASAGVIVVGADIQRDMNDLKLVNTGLANQLAATKQETVLTTKAMNSRIEQLTDKADKVFAVDNMDHVLQVTRELRKQVQALAGKKLAIMSHQRNQPPKPSEISLPSLTLSSEKQQQSDQTLEVNPVEQNDNSVSSHKFKKSRGTKKHSRHHRASKSAKNK